MDSFQLQFYSLPLLVQQEISDIIVSNYPPSESLNFGIVSRHCFTLFQRAKPRKEISKLSITFNNEKECEIYNDEFSRPKKLISVESIVEFLAEIYVIDSVDISWNQAINNSFFPEIWSELSAAMKFTKTVSITTVAFDEKCPKLLVDFISRLSNCDNLTCIGRRTTFKHPIFEIIQALKKHRRLTFMRSNEADDKFLESLSQKTCPKNPLESLCIFSNNTFTVKGVTNFLQESFFAKTARISLTPLTGAPEEFINAFKRFGTVENIPSRNGILLRTSESTLTFSFPLGAEIPENPSTLSFDFRPFWRGLGRRILPSL
uniref:DUF38 domain-containing protein n=1 Tax=Panagrolaimus superbus TaxID=310955 RepID=A0A914YB58_9BILA